MQVFYTYVDNFIDRKNKRESYFYASFRTVACWKRHKRLVTPLFWNGFSAISSLFFVVNRKESIFGISEFFYVCLYANFHFRDSHVTTFRHPSSIYAKCLVTDSRLAKGTPSVSRLSIGTLVWSKTVSRRLCAG